ncbi:complex I assembly factor TIMMDC1, mitochondrial [Lithobates pipiens]
MGEGSPAGPRGPSPLPADSQFLPPPDLPQSGWERVRNMYRRNDRGELSEEAEFMLKSALTGWMVGMVYGGVPAARFSREQYIKNHQAEVYRHRVEAVRSAHNAALRGFIRYGFRWGWRIAAFVTIFNGVSSGLSAYRDKVVISHFAAAGAVTGGLFRINLGLRGLIGGSVIGVMLGVPVGALISGLQALVGEDLLEYKRKQHRKLYEEKLQEWGERMQFTDVILQDMQTADTESASTQMEKITELLQQPRNPDWGREE